MLLVALEHVREYIHDGGNPERQRMLLRHTSTLLVVPCVWRRFRLSVGAY